ncbi:MAG: serine/threonine-protein kinase, partial [Myxococcota bacterium]
MLAPTLDSAIPPDEEAPNLPLPPGTIVGSYRLLEVLGEGGMGIVYVAEHLKLGRRVALKMLRSEWIGNAVIARRFFAEARAVNRVSHDHVVQITDLIEDLPSGICCIVMELLEGRTLLDVLESDGVMALPRAAAIAEQIASALQAVHDGGIVHRDLKPENVFLVANAAHRDFVKVLDFGIARLMGPPESRAPGITLAGAVLGTPEYMSPEQASGESVDHRTDIYAFGVILYRLVTGRLPFIGKSFSDFVIQHASVTPTPTRKLPNLPHAIPPALDELILQCLAKDPALRPSRIGDLGDRLRALATERGWTTVDGGGAQATITTPA